MNYCELFLKIYRKFESDIHAEIRQGLIMTKQVVILQNILPFLF